MWTCGLWKGENVNEVEEEEKKMTDEEKNQGQRLLESGDGGGGILARTDFVFAC